MIILKYTSEFYEIISDIIKNTSFQKLNLHKHHYLYTRFEHSLSVSYYSYLICKFLKFDYISATRAGLLHDLFFYDCENKLTRPKHHIHMHPKIALKNAENLFSLNSIEKDIIQKHMWPLTLSVPQYRESFVVTLVDKFCAFKEWYRFCAYALLKKLNWSLLKLNIG